MNTNAKIKSSSIQSEAVGCPVEVVSNVDRLNQIPSDLASVEEHLQELMSQIGLCVDPIEQPGDNMSLVAALEIMPSLVVQKCSNIHDMLNSVMGALR